MKVWCFCACLCVAKESRLTILADSKWERPVEPRHGVRPKKPMLASFAHTVYEGQTYTAYLDHKARLFVMPKVKPGGSEYAFNGAIQITCSTRYYDSALRAAYKNQIENRNYDIYETQHHLDQL